MTKHRREERKQRQEVAEGEIRWPAMLRALVLSGSVALFVIGALLPSESAISDGTYAPLAAGWCLLLILWAASVCLDDRPTIQIGWTELFGVALVGWHSLAALASLGQTNGRQALNAHWLILGYGLTVFLLRQVVREVREARCLVAAMIWLATLLASLGLFQYFYSMPIQRAAYQRDPDKVLAANQIPTEPDSPQRQQFENRLRSVEPLATFALTNSLAGVLAPWLIAMLAIGYASLRRPGQWQTVICMSVLAILVGACFLLTKSRTAYLAVMAGLVLLVLFARSSGRSWINWQFPAAIAGVAVVLGLAAVFFGGLDVQVLSEAPKSVLYRIEYWQATARVIAQYPLFGCGPGNFQEAYAAYKLPQASEMPADPHNFLLEMWSTAGTPAVLLLVALLAGFALDMAAAQRRVHAHPSPVDTNISAVAAPQWLVLAGAIAGLLVAAPVASAMSFPLESVSEDWRWLPAAWLLGLPLIAISWWALWAWMKDGELPLSALVIPQLVLLINLLAAGAIVFPGVMATLLVLLPLSLAVVATRTGSAMPEKNHPVTLPVELRVPALAAGFLLFGAFVLTGTCFYTEYYPVLNGRRALSDALYRLEVKDFRTAPAKLIAAAEADSLSPEPRQYLAELLLGKWEATQSPQDWLTFVESADAYRRLNPRHHLAWYLRGNWFLSAWKKSQRKEELDAALAAYRQAVQHYPNHALYQAQLAWALHLAGDAQAAREQAEIAYQLDQKMPHQEQKLNRRHIADPDAQQPGRTYREESAEQTVDRLRTASAEQK